MQHALIRPGHRKYSFFAPLGPSQEPLFEIRSHFRCPWQKRKLTLDLAEDTSIVFVSKPFDFEGNIDVTRRGKVERTLGTITKKIVAVHSALTNLAGYDVTAFEGTDLALCFAFVTVLDEERELRQKKKKKKR
jgi:hypothetical protein